MGACYHNYDILQTKRATCTLNKEILDLQNKEIFSGVPSVELFYKFDEKLSVYKSAKVPFKLFGGSHIYIYTAFARSDTLLYSIRT